MEEMSPPDPAPLKFGRRLRRDVIIFGAGVIATVVVVASAAAVCSGREQKVVFDGGQNTAAAFVDEGMIAAHDAALKPGDSATVGRFHLEVLASETTHGAREVSVRVANATAVPIPRADLGDHQIGVLTGWTSSGLLTYKPDGDMLEPGDSDIRSFFVPAFDRANPTVVTLFDRGSVARIVGREPVRVAPGRSQEPILSRRSSLVEQTPAVVSYESLDGPLLDGDVQQLSEPPADPNTHAWQRMTIGVAMYEMPPVGAVYWARVSPLVPIGADSTDERLTADPSCEPSRWVDVVAGGNINMFDRTDRSVVIERSGTAACVGGGMIEFGQSPAVYLNGGAWT